MDELTVHLTGSNRMIAKEIMRRIAQRANRAMIALARTGRSALKSVIQQAILDSEEMEDLRVGKLQGQLGLSPSLAANVPQDIAEAVADSIELIPRKTYVKGSTGLQGGMSLSIQPSDFSNILNMPDSTIRYYSTRYKRIVTLDWLNWLLKQGQEVIVSNYIVNYGNHGRSGQAKMKRSMGAVWKVDSKYSGTIDDNFISRALNDPSVRNNILKVLNQLMNQYFSG